MSYNRPSLTDIKSRFIAEIDSQLPEADARLAKSNLDVIASIHSQAVYDLHAHIDYVYKQILPDTAEKEVLERHANLWGINRKAASFAVGTITVTGDDGSVIPENTKLQRGDGSLYVVTADETIASGEAVVNVTAEEAGIDGNCIVGAGFSLVSPIAGINSDSTVIDVSAGADEETDSSLRTRIIARIQTPPHGGAKFDYEAWSTEIAGVKKTWVYPLHLGAGTVGVTFISDVVDNPIPSDELVAAVQANIDANRPVTADVTVFKPTATPLDISIQITPNTQAVKDAITAEIQDMLDRRAEPAGTIYLSHINEAISLASGEFDHVLVSPVSNITHGTGAFPVMGNLTWS